ncbi:MAG: zinc transporter ZupT [Actinobacteria bacterium]|nr:zinc transporter ZupT [Actinomycetota bacterium]
MFDSVALRALLVTAIAGLATTIGSLLGLMVKKESPKFMCSVLGFTAGIMIGISFFEMLPSSFEEIGFLKASLAFVGGFIFIFAIDFFIPHEYIGQTERITENTNQKLLRTGIFVALGIGIHNLPEGMATFYSFLSDEKIGIAIAVAVAIHNIPEGIAVSSPIYKATGSRKKAFLYSFLSGVAEPVGAIATALFLLPFLNAAVLGYILAAISGIMTFISIDELVPVSISYGYSHLPILSFLAGIIVMIASLFLLN